MKFYNRILVLISVIVGMIAVKYDFWGFEEYKEGIIIGVIGFVFIDYAVNRILNFYRYTFLQTKYDLFFRISNLLVGLIALGFALKYKDYFFDFGWILSVFGLLGLANGIAYQASVQLWKKTNKLIVKHNHRDKKEFESIDSITYESGKITIAEKQRIVEVNDLKDSKKNRWLLNDFISKYYPDIIMTKK